MEIGLGKVTKNLKGPAFLREILNGYAFLEVIKKFSHECTNVFLWLDPSEMNKKS